jgi:hypothetical protein
MVITEKTIGGDLTRKALETEIRKEGGVEPFPISLTNL